MRVTPDYKLVQVYWLCKGNETDEVIHKILTKNAGQLRHELTQLRVIGVVPKILFCKDKTVATLAEIDERLKKADFGEDHVEVDLVSKLKTELELNSPLEPDIKVCSVNVSFHIISRSVLGKNKQNRCRKCRWCSGSNSSGDAPKRFWLKPC